MQYEIAQPMIALETDKYRIERYSHHGKLRYAVDRKEAEGDHVCFVNVGWYETYQMALDAMNRDYLSLENGQVI